MAGKKCGVCHGTVAFPVSTCKRCLYETREVAAGNVGAKVRRTPKLLDRRSRPPRPH